METSLKPGFAQTFSCCPKNLSCPKLGGAAAPLAPPARTPMQMFLLVYIGHVVAHAGQPQLGVSIQISISLGKTFLRIRI